MAVVGGTAPSRFKSGVLTKCWPTRDVSERHDEKECDGLRNCPNRTLDDDAGDSIRCAGLGDLSRDRCSLRSFWWTVGGDDSNAVEGSWWCIKTDGGSKLLVLQLPPNNVSSEVGCKSFNSTDMEVNDVLESPISLLLLVFTRPFEEEDVIEGSEWVTVLSMARDLLADADSDPRSTSSKVENEERDGREVVESRGDIRAFDDGWDNGLLMLLLSSYVENEESDGIEVVDPRSATLLSEVGLVMLTVVALLEDSSSIVPSFSAWEATRQSLSSALVPIAAPIVSAAAI